MPSVRCYRNRQVWGVALTLSLVVSACGRSGPPAAGAPPAVQVQVQKLQPGTFEESSDFVGSLEAEQRIELRPEVSGRVTQVLVSSGSAVNLGQPIVQLSPDQTQAEVTAAQAAAQAASFGRQAAQSQVEAARAQLARAQADVELALVEFRRTQQLVSAGALSRQNLDNAQNQLTVAQTAQRQAEDNVRSVEAQLQQALSAFEQAEAEVNVSQADLGFKQVVAPTSGIVGDMSLRVGDFVESGDTLATITQNSDLFLRIRVPTTQANQLRLGIPVELLNPETGEPLATGSLSFISPEVDGEGQSILVKARFPNEAGNLRDGQFVKARLIWNTTATLLVPTVAVIRVAGQSFVFVATDQSQENGQTLRVASQRPVQLGEIQGNNYQVIDGLEAGDEVIVTNILQLQDGRPVTSEAQTSAVLH
ncbi:efflux RND transporter periplasmic adaptor subunit [Nodosilinea sp. LEGE 07088]|uniref:efflux RND transporter periplasmic adaptor subunit n=1 Tax=Nodosilinea sp. LEGE 07088 TaxID=2777968 RepID=UPI00188184D0|nr:efflux RND transporter periplasmic adaptor subunit [Nodosilinea sp. LEGE 07088]MBE9136737.1 efflux RND transporter periplasmic adaptor subunit [Nodosilinea sp. LEGE 07088]